MGTNYYAKKKNGHLLHIGKSSAGNPFTFRGHLGAGLTSSESWYSYLQGPVTIVDEYGRTMNLPHFWANVAKSCVPAGSCSHRWRSAATIDGDRKRWVDTHGQVFSAYEFC